jgi:hypothetical protein
VLCLFAAFAQCPSAVAAVVAPPKYNVDIRQTSVSGLSSGGFMAVQFDVGYSSFLKGAGIIAGGPYDCAQGSLTTALQPCMAANGSTNVSTLIGITEQNARNQAIDPTSGLASHTIWMFSGTADSVVKQSVMNDLRTYYSHYISNTKITSMTWTPSMQCPPDSTEIVVPPKAIPTTTTATSTGPETC